MTFILFICIGNKLYLYIFLFNINRENSGITNRHNFVSWRNWYQTMWNFLAHLLIYMESLPEDVHLLKRLRKSWKVDFRCQVPRTSVQVRYHFKWFFKLHNLRNSDSNSMCSKTLKNPEFTLNINHQYFQIFLVLVIISATVTSTKSKIAPGRA